MAAPGQTGHNTCSAHRAVPRVHDLRGHPVHLRRGVVTPLALLPESSDSARGYLYAAMRMTKLRPITADTLRAMDSLGQHLYPARFKYRGHIVQ